MTGLHTGHAWIRGNGELPLATGGRHRREVLRAAGYHTGVVGKWGLGDRTTGNPTSQGFDYWFGFLDQRHAHRQYTDHSVAQRQSACRLRRRRRTTPTTSSPSEALEFIERDRPRGPSSSI